MTDLSTIERAIDWLRDNHDGSRLVPSRLHRHDTEGELGAPPFSAPFMAYLMARPTDEVTVRETVDCDHLHDAGWPKCAVDRAYYRAPMWRAMKRLAGRRPMIRPSHPSPYALVVYLIDSGYDWRRTSERLELPYEVGEPLILMALRALHGQYAKGPVPQRSWVDMSESQQRALSQQGAVA